MKSSEVKSQLISLYFAGKITPSKVDPTLSSAARILFSKEGTVLLCRIILVPSDE